MLCHTLLPNYRLGGLGSLVAQPNNPARDWIRLKFRNLRQRTNGMVSITNFKIASTARSVFSKLLSRSGWKVSLWWIWRQYCWNVTVDMQDRQKRHRVHDSQSYLAEESNLGDDRTTSHCSYRMRFYNTALPFACWWAGNTARVAVCSESPPVPYAVKSKSEFKAYTCDLWSLCSV